VKNIILTEKDLNILTTKNEVRGSGSLGVLYEIPNDELIKLYYKDFVDEFIKRDYSTLHQTIEITKEVYQFLKYEPELNRIKKLIERQKYITMTQLPIGVVTFESWLIGVILKYHGNCLNLGQYIEFISRNELISILKIVRSRIDELHKNYIYPTDIKENNILVNPNDKSIYLIDLDDLYTRVLDEYDEYSYNYSNTNLNDFNNAILKRHTNLRERK
jgi:serine/threonine protein kinase